ncbi:MAG: DUF4430 domain-containing protein [Saccharofermentanales bacterium]
MNIGLQLRRMVPILAALALVAFTAAGAAAQPLGEATVGLRIEGISQNIYYGDVTVPDTGDLSVADILAAADGQSAGLTITGVDIGFISDINGDASGSFGGWDGWLFKVNGAEPAVGIPDYPIIAGDEILLYYGDPYGVGMQFPEADLSGLGTGVITFTSRDTTFDAEYNPVTTTNPVAGATVTWYTGTETTTYTTDASGEITIPSLYLTPGMHKVQISKLGSALSDDRHIPLVLRLPPDYTVEITAPADSTDSVPESVEDSSAASDAGTSSDTSPQTGDSGNTIYFAFFILAAAALSAAYSSYRQTVKEQR